MIRVEDLTKFYGTLCAVDHISLSIDKGEILGLLGPNGAGKTTTLRMLTGFARPSSGKIQMKDYDLDEDLIAIKKLLGYLPESAPLYREMLVYDYLRYVADIREMPSDGKLSRIRQLVEICGLHDVMHKPIAEISRGYKQRVGLASAMMDDPEILVLDEPTSGLDPNQIVEIRGIIKEIGKEKTIIFSTHILSEAEATCDRIAIIHKGKIVADGNTEELKESAREEHVIHISLRNADPDSVNDRLGSLEGVVKVAPQDRDDDAAHFNVTWKSSDDLRERIYEAIKKTDWVLLEFRQETRSLENIFRELTKEN